MTTITYNTRTQRPTSVLATVRRTLAAFFEGIEDGLDMADRYHTLSRMSDEQLAKQGLARSSVARAVVLGHGRI
jgi:putative NIF3 family GTP cyclohydrolase 1 type 2